MLTPEWLAQPMCRLLTLALLHFLWQGLAVALALIVVVESCRIRSAGARYACSLVALLTMALCPLATMAWLQQFHPDGSALESRGFDLFSTRALVTVASRAPSLDAAQRYALAGWFAGVFIFGGRLLAGAIGLSRLRRGRQPLPLKVAAVVEHLGQQMAMQALPVVFLSRQAAEAMAVGLIRPLVLIPASWAAQMPLEMLEAVIAHELAHLRRRDLWVNLLQRIVETLLFYHPAVWWLSRRLRIERELCADELAVAATGKRLEYAQALEQIAQQRQAEFRPALAAFLRGEANMRLLQRVRNVLGQPPCESSRLWPAGLLALALPLGLWAATALNSPAAADDDREEGKPPQATDAEFVRRFYLDFIGRLPTPDEVRFVLADDDDRDEPKKPSVKRDRDQGDRDKRPSVRKEADEKRSLYGENLRIEPRGHDDRRLDELTALVKRLVSQVERLQDEVARLRGEKPSDKSTGEPRKTLTRTTHENEAQEQLDKRKLELRQDLEKIEMAKRAIAEKERALTESLKKDQPDEARRVLKEQIEKEVIKKKLEAEEQARAARDKAEAAREAGEKKEAILRRSLKERDEKIADEKKREAAEQKSRAARDKAEATRDAVERKIRELKDRDIEPLEKEALLRKLRDQQYLLTDPGKPQPKPKPEPRKPALKDRDDDERRQ